MIGTKNPSPYQGMTMKHIIASRLQTNAAGINETVTASLSPSESRRNWNIQANLGKKNFPGNDITRVVLPHDGPQSQHVREAEKRRQYAQPWESVFMHTPTDGNRLNNPAQQSFIRQRRLSAPSSYGQFYAFMKAMSAAFGTLQG